MLESQQISARKRVKTDWFRTKEEVKGASERGGERRPVTSRSRDDGFSALNTTTGKKCKRRGRKKGEKPKGTTLYGRGSR